MVNQSSQFIQSVVSTSAVLPTLKYYTFLQCQANNRLNLTQLCLFTFKVQLQRKFLISINELWLYEITIYVIIVIIYL